MATRGFSRGVTKVVKSDVSHSKLRKQPFLLKFSKSSGGPWALPVSPSDAHVCDYLVIDESRDVVQTKKVCERIKK